MVDAAIGAGGDNLNLGGIAFQVSNRAAVEDSVRLAAADNAVAKARVLAERVGVTLGRAVIIRESGGASPVPVLEAAPLDGALSVQIFSGSQTVTASVEIQFEIS